MSQVVFALTSERVAIFFLENCPTDYEKREKIRKNGKILETSKKHEHRNVIEKLKSWKRTFSKKS